jgi:hypothetical protein
MKTVLDHKYFSPVCHERGCQYLVIHHLLPATFYADRDIKFRIEQMVSEWQRAIQANLKLEDEVETLKSDLYWLKQERQP